MVPVPEDLVDDVDRYMTWIVKRDSVPRGQEQAMLDAGAGAYLAAAPPARRLLITVARAAAEGVSISVADTAAAVGLSLHEAMGIVGEANINFVQLKGGFAMVVPIPNPAPVPDGYPAWAHTLLTMQPDVAEMLLGL